MELRQEHKSIQILEIKENKKQYLDLLLLADEQEDMIDRYLERGDLFVLMKKDAVAAECVVTKEEHTKGTRQQGHTLIPETETGGIYELKNIATAPAFQRQGYGRTLIEFIFSHYTDLTTLYVGTGDSPLTLDFYKSCGFSFSHRIPHFFTEYYDHPIFEGGKQLIDMVYLKRERTR